MAVSKFCNAFEALRDGRSGAAPGAGEAAVLLICSVIYPKPYQPHAGFCRPPVYRPLTMHRKF